MSGTFPEGMQPPPAGPILVGYSGGLDSSVLLHALAGDPVVRGHGLRAIHVSHGLHPDALDWSRHCRANCSALAIELVVVDVQVARDSPLGLEGAARQARHAAFAAELRRDETLALAHHQDDQAETVLLRLLRASASEGLAAMRPVRPIGLGSLWRPLLGTPRSGLLEYANAHGLRWIEDSSNAEQQQDRNFLRHRIMPRLRERWPAASAAFARSAELLAEDAALLREEARRRLATVRGDQQDSLSVPALLSLAPAWRSRVVREWLAQLQLPNPPGAAFAIIDTQLLGARSAAVAQYRWSDIVLTRWRELLHVERQRDALPADWRADWDGHAELCLPTGDALVFAASPATDCNPADNGQARDDAVDALGKLQVCARSGGERIQLAGRKHTHSLKHCLQEFNVPPWRRRLLPLLKTGDGEVLAAGDSILSARLARHCSARGLRLVWRHASPSH